MGERLLKIDDALTRFHAKKWRYWVLFPSLFVLVYLLYFIFCFASVSYGDIYAGTSLSLLGTRSVASAICLLVLVVAAILLGILYLLFLKKHERLTSDKILVFFIVQYSLVILAVNFLIKANTSLGHVDWCVFDSYGANETGYRPGHWHVILDIFHSGLLPDPPVVNGSYWYENQYYQNKLFHLAMGYFMRWNGLFINVGNATTVDAAANSFVFSETEDVLMEMNRILQLYWGILMPIFLAKLLKELGFQGRRQVTSLALFLFIPLILLLPLFLNNDLLAFDFTLLMFIYALKWHHHPTYPNIVITALAMGLGMATKINVGVFAFVLGPLFVYDLIRIHQKKNEAFLTRYASHPYGHYVGEMAAFAVIVFPLGLFFSIYNLVQYGIPFGYVWDNGPTARIYINGDFYNPFLRFCLFPAPDMFFSISPLLYREGVAGSYYDVWGTQDFNIWTGLFKSLLFNGADFINYRVFDAWYYQLLFYSLYLVFFLYVCYVLFYSLLYLGKAIRRHYPFFQSERNSFLVLLSVVELGSYLYFNIRYPFACTMNGRYILSFLVVFSIVGSKGLNEGYDALKSRRSRRG